ncbi:radical SAM protein [Hathewaya histolytica]|uniref:radical SAM protein n=1 Tax=Hathewaya histolytica TaxID=1498 RepID=UPI003B6789A0
MYLSKYITITSLDNKEKEYIIIHSYLGNIDIVSSDIGKQILEARKDNSALYNIPLDILRQMKKKKYIVDSEIEDKERFLKIANKISSKIREKSLAYILIPSYECNFRCPYCFEANTVEKNEKYDPMSRELVDIIFQDIDNKQKNNTKVNITLFGGEPLLEKNLDINAYICEEAIKRNIPIHAITNGYSIDEYYNLFKKGYFTNLQITIDGIQEGHDKRRYLENKQPTFSKIIQNIGEVLNIERGPSITVRINVDKDNYNEVIKLKDFFQEKNWIDNKKFNFYTKSVHACYVPTKDRVYDSDVVDNVILDKENLKNMQFNMQYKRMVEDVKKIFDVNEKLPNLRTCTCGAANGMRVIDNRGNIYSCWEQVDNDENIVGHVDINKRAFIYNELWESWQNRHIENIEKCSQCGYSLICGGNCPAHAKYATGDMFSSYCTDIKKTYNRVVKEVLLQNEK